MCTRHYFIGTSFEGLLPALIVSGLAYGIFGWWGLTLAISVGFASAVWPAGEWQYSLYLQRQHSLQMHHSFSSAFSR